MKKFRCWFALNQNVWTVLAEMKAGGHAIERELREEYIGVVPALTFDRKKSERFLKQ
ncbi:MAG: hypothetical protein JO066_08175 [Verrucomicrobia bacterium]|nr:hypothetical protein [Verrucomicrobiota bacterium]